MPCRGPKKSPRTSSIMQIIFSFWSFEIGEDILRNQKIVIGLDSFSKQCLDMFSLIWILLVFVSAPRDLHRRAAYSICESWVLIYQEFIMIYLFVLDDSLTS